MRGGGADREEEGQILAECGADVANPTTLSS